MRLFTSQARFIPVLLILSTTITESNSKNRGWWEKLKWERLTPIFIPKWKDLLSWSGKFNSLRNCASPIIGHIN